ncbi:MAG: hypothetical protein KF729_29290 [Sandaracinaceae bacterium]|nr:hypothetical protein [Sandaracinaceae bacterium]
MSDIDARIEERVRAFTKDLRALIGEAAHEAIDQAFRSAGMQVAAVKAAAPKAAAPKAAAPAAPKAAAAPAAGGKRKPRPKGTRRTSEQMIRDLEVLREYVAANPGKTALELGGVLGMATREMTRPLSKLIASGDVYKDGVKSHTRYYPASAGGGGGAKRGGKKR